MRVLASFYKIKSLIQVILINEDLIGRPNRMHRELRQVKILGTWLVVKGIQEKPSTYSLQEEEII